MTGTAAGDESRLAAGVPERYKHLFDVGHSVNGFAPVGGNTAHLLADSNNSIAVLGPVL
jgi:cardiolipin synthase